MKIQFRRMTFDDVPEIFRLEQLIFTDSWPREHFINDIKNEKVAYPCVMLLQEKIVGYAVVWYVSRELHINNIAIVPDFRRRGFAGKLLEHILEKFEDWQVAFLEVRYSNVAAINLYKKYLFKEAVMQYGYYSDGEDAIIMIREKQADLS